MRRIALFSVLGMLMGAIALPASATMPGTDPGAVDGHKIWICHATRSLSNPYVKILIDIAAWDTSDPNSTAHGPEHHLREKDGFIWSDYALENPTDECIINPPPPPPPGLLCPDGNAADYVIQFDGSKLRGEVRPDHQTQTVAANVAAGTYATTLISGDILRGGGPGHFLYQPNEQWRLGGSVPSGFSDDLVDGYLNITGVVSYVSPVTFNEDVTTVTAEHWSYAPGNDDPYDSSVIPEYACLTRID